MRTMVLEWGAILELHAAALRAALADRRTALLSGLDPAFVASLPATPSPAAQLLADLNGMNQAGQLADGSLPLRTWLLNATHLAALRREAEVFRRALASVGGQPVNGRPSVTAAGPAEAVAKRSDARSDARAGAAVEVVCVTALGLEDRAVLGHLSARREETLPTGTVAEIGAFEAPSRRIYAAVVEGGAGNSATAALTQEVISHFKPKIVIFVGVAGGLKDVRIGDVVAATKVYGYESGKAEDEFRTRPDVGQSSYRLVQRARAEARQFGWLKRLGADPTAADLPRVHVGAIAAGAAVIASTNAPLYTFLREHYGDALAVEMEGRGFLEATYRNLSDALVVRGISDLIDKKGEADAGGSQPSAARNAAAFAFEVVGKVLA